MTSTTKPLTSSQARALVTATVVVGKAKARLEKAKKALAELRARYKPLIPTSTEPDDEGKDVRQIEVGRWRVRVSTWTAADAFSLKGYREAGHEITAAMREHITPGRTNETWTVTDLEGPTKPGAVEPT